MNPYISALAPAFAALTALSVVRAEPPRALLHDTFGAVPERGVERRMEGRPVFTAANDAHGVAFPAASDKLVYPVAGTVNPERGTVEFWLEPLFDFGDSKNNESLLRIGFGPEDGMALYYNGGNQGFVFYAWDKDDPSPRHHSHDLATFLPSRKLHWRKGEKHHVAVTWQRDVQRIYLDGERDRHSYFEGGIKVASPAGGMIEVGGGRFRISEIRIWDGPRAPRNRVESPVDGGSSTPMTPSPSAGESLALSGRDIRMVVAADSHAPLVLKAGPALTSWLKAPGSVEVHASADSPVSPAATVRWFEEGGLIVCEVDLRNPDAMRHAVGDLVLVLPALEKDTMVFVAADDSPFRAEEGRPFYDGRGQVVYGQDASLPIVCLYSPEKDAGFTVFGDDASLEDIAFDPGFASGEGLLEVRRLRVRVAPGGREIRRWFFAGHAGDWRPGLGAYAMRFPGILAPPCGPLATGDSAMIIGGPSDDAFLAALRDLGVGWRQVSLFLGEGARFGNYIPDDLAPYAVAVEGFRKGIASQRRHGLHSMLYIQARECHDVARAEQEFADSIVRLPDGSPEVDKHGPFGATMTCRPGTAWFNHLLEQGRRELATFPDADGFFFDNAWRNEYADILRALADLAHSNGKSLAANGGNARSVAWSDAIMAESFYTALGDLKYLGLATPIVYVPIYSQGAAPGKEREMRAPGVAANLQRDLKECLLSGAFYSFNYRGTNYWEGTSSKIFADYLPLQRLLNGRRWVLTPHALLVPDDLDGNVFESPSGNWLVTLVDKASDWTRPEKMTARGGVVTVTAPDGRKPVNAVLHVMGQADQSVSPGASDGSRWRFALPPFCGAAVLEIFWEAKPSTSTAMPEMPLSLDPSSWIEVAGGNVSVRGGVDAD